MSITYDGGLGTTVTVRPVDSSVSVGFDSTLVLVGEADTEEATVDPHTPTPLESVADAEEAFGEGSEIPLAYTLAAANGAATIYGIHPSEETDTNYSEAFEAAASVNPRFVCALSEEDSVATDLLGVLNSNAENFRFARGIVPADADIAVGDIGTYTPSSTDLRLIEVAPNVSVVGGSQTYTAAAVAGMLTAQPLGSSITYNTLNGIEELGTQYKPTEADNFEGVTAVTDSHEVLEGVTTSEEAAFEDIFQCEIVDTVAQSLYEISKDYAGDAPNNEDERDNLTSDMRIQLQSMASQSPPLLSDAADGPAFDVGTSLGADTDEVDVDVKVSPLDVMKQINVGIDVGTIVTYDGASAE